jgi:hypothetical protein
MFSQSPDVRKNKLAELWQRTKEEATKFGITNLPLVMKAGAFVGSAGAVAGALHNYSLNSPLFNELPLAGGIVGVIAGASVKIIDQIVEHICDPATDKTDMEQSQFGRALLFAERNTKGLTKDELKLMAGLVEVEVISTVTFGAFMIEQACKSKAHPLEAAFGILAAGAVCTVNTVLMNNAFQAWNDLTHTPPRP